MKEKLKKAREAIVSFVKAIPGFIKKTPTMLRNLVVAHDAEHVPSYRRGAGCQCRVCRHHRCDGCSLWFAAPHPVHVRLNVNRPGRLSCRRGFLSICKGETNA